MIILSIGMPRAGSGWFYNLTNDLAIAAGFQDAKKIRRDYHLEKILTEVNCNIGALSAKRLTAVMVPALAGKDFVIKAHAKPTSYAKLLIKLSLIKPTYIYRDPRDAMLSAMENGARARERGQSNAFSQLDSFDKALEFMKTYVQISEDWLQCKKIFHTRYEDLLLNYDHETKQLITYLQLPLNEVSRKEIIEKYRPESVKQDQKGLHYRHGKIGRFRDKMTDEQIDILNRTFGEYLQRHGYSI